MDESVKDSYVRKVNFCSILEKDRTKDYFLEATTESIRIGKSQDRKGVS